jgi:hypothetical protein
MLVTTQNEIQSLMPTARWDKPQVLFGYLEEEEAVALEPLLGASLYQHVLTEYDRLRQEYVDITATTVRPTGKAKQDSRLAHADVTERLEQVAQGKYRETYTTPEEGEKEVPAKDMKTIRLIRICQQIEWYRMLANKAGLLTISFNEGGGMNISVGESYDAADEKAKDRAVKDALGGAGRATDSLLLFLEADAKGEKLFTEMWQEADAFYLNKDLLFQTATVLDKFLDIKKQRMAYVSLVRDIRFCQNTYLKPRIGAKLLKAVVSFANDGKAAILSQQTGQDGEGTTGTEPAGETTGTAAEAAALEELTELLRQALAFYVESRRTTITRTSLTVSTSARGTGSSIEKEERLARRDSMTDAQQAMAMACDYIAENLEALGDAAVGTPIYNIAREREAQAERERQCACAAEARRRRAACEQSRKRLFTAFPATHRTPEIK